MATSLNNEPYHPAAVYMNGYARAPGIQVRFLGRLCTGGTSVVLATTTSTTTPSFQADSTGQRGYAYSATLDLVSSGLVTAIGNPADVPTGCADVRVEELVAGTWRPIATFGPNAQTCYNQQKAANPNITWMQAIEACRRKGTNEYWVRFSFTAFG